MRKGYVTLMSDAVVLKPNERNKLRDGCGNALAIEDCHVVPALKIARLAACKELRASRRGIGEALVRFSFCTGLDLSEAVGWRLLTLDALPFYVKLGFVRNLDTAYEDKPRPSTRLDLFAGHQRAQSSLRHLLTPTEVSAEPPSRSPIRNRACFLVGGTGLEPMTSGV